MKPLSDFLVKYPTTNNEQPTTVGLDTILTTFNSGLGRKYNTILLGGFSEPIYIPAQQDSPAEIRFTHDYIRSALHELSHWFVAGAKRRMLLDYGYWYLPDGRNQLQQAAFFKVEALPQAIEWVLSDACSIPFEVSVDNLEQTVNGKELFLKAVEIQKKRVASAKTAPRVFEFLQDLI